MRPIFKYRPAWALAIGDGGTEVITGDGGGGSISGYGTGKTTQSEDFI